MSAPLGPDKARTGMPITAGNMNELLRAVLRRIRGGRGVTVNSYGDGIVIDAAGAGRAGADGGLAIPWVAELPPIPEEPETTLLVYWATSGEMSGGTGDGQIWATSTGKERWRPLERYTPNGGIPSDGS